MMDSERAVEARDLANRIEAFCAERGISLSRFQAVVRIHDLVAKLREGRLPYRATVKRIELVMQNWSDADEQQARDERRQQSVVRHIQSLVDNDWHIEITAIAQKFGVTAEYVATIVNIETKNRAPLSKFEREARDGSRKLIEALLSAKCPTVRRNVVDLRGLI